MSLTISTNTSSLRAGACLARNNLAAQRSMNRLSTGQRLSTPMDDPGGLAVSMKLNSSINRLQGAVNNVQTAISFLEVQDGALEAVGKILERMSELKGLASQDPMKSDLDKASYNNEFHDLQSQLYDISQMKFNGVSLFARKNDVSPYLKEAWFLSSDSADWAYQLPRSFWDNTQTIYTSADGATGSKVSIHKAPLLSALTIDNNYFSSLIPSAPVYGAMPYGTTDSGNNDADGNENTKYIARLAVDVSSSDNRINNHLDLDDVAVGLLIQALENVSYLRSQNGGSQSRLAFNLESLDQQKTNMRAAHGRIVDTDLADESTNLATQLMLSQMSASVLAQANASANTTLLLLN